MSDTDNNGLDVLGSRPIQFLTAIALAASLPITDAAADAKRKGESCVADCPKIEETVRVAAVPMTKSVEDICLVVSMNTTRYHDPNNKRGDGLGWYQGGFRVFTLDEAVKTFGDRNGIQTLFRVHGSNTIDLSGKVYSVRNQGASATAKATMTSGPLKKVVDFYHSVPGLHASLSEQVAKGGMMEALDRQCQKGDAYKEACTLRDAYCTFTNDLGRVNIGHKQITFTYQGKTQSAYRSHPMNVMQGSSVQAVDCSTIYQKPLTDFSNGAVLFEYTIGMHSRDVEAAKRAGEGRKLSSPNRAGSVMISADEFEKMLEGTQYQSLFQQNPQAALVAIQKAELSKEYQGPGTTISDKLFTWGTRVAVTFSDADRGVSGVRGWAWRSGNDLRDARMAFSRSMEDAYRIDAKLTYLPGAGK